MAPRRPGAGDFTWHELATTDAQAAMDFYTALLGWEAGPVHDMGPAGLYHLFLHNGNQYGGMYVSSNWGGPSWLCYIGVEDAGKAVAAAKAAGGRVLNGPMEVPGGSWVAQVLDSDGAPFAVHEPARATSQPAASAPEAKPAKAPKPAKPKAPKPEKAAAAATAAPADEPPAVTTTSRSRPLRLNLLRNLRQSRRFRSPRQRSPQQRSQRHRSQRPGQTRREAGRAGRQKQRQGKDSEEGGQEGRREGQGKSGCEKVRCREVPGDEQGEEEGRRQEKVRREAGSAGQKDQQGQQEGREKDQGEETPLSVSGTSAAPVE